MSTEVQTDWESELTRLEEAVNKSDGDGVRARWQSGAYLLTLCPGKQLPRGMAATLTASLGIHRSELTARMKFAKKFPESTVPKEKRMTVVEQCRTALIEALDVYGDKEATAEVLAKVAEVPYEGDLPVYAQAIAAVAHTVWQQKLDDAAVRIAALKQQAAGLTVMNLLPLSNITH